MARGCEYALLWSSSTLCLIALVLMIVSFATPYWGKNTYSTSGSEHVGLWRYCFSLESYSGQSDSQCFDLIDQNNLDGRVRAAQGAGIMSLLSGVSTTIFQIIYVFLRNGAMKICITVFAGLSAFFTSTCFITMGAYIVDVSESDSLDYSFGLMVAAFALYLALFVLSFFLPVARKQVQRMSSHTGTPVTTV